MRKLLHIALPVLFAVISTSALAMYKCDANGSVSYSDEPCASGKSLNINNTRNGENDPTKQLTADKRELKRLETERHKREAKDQQEYRRIALANASAQKKCRSLAQRKQWADEDVAATAGKASDKAKRKARRVGEQYALECGH